MLPAAVLVQASPYVPNLDPAYQDLDALVAQGLVRDIILGERPYSRVAFARFAQEARRRIDTAGEAAIKPRFLEALERIELRFHRELAAFGRRLVERVVPRHVGFHSGSGMRTSSFLPVASKFPIGC